MVLVYTVYIVEPIAQTRTIVRVSEKKRDIRAAALRCDRNIAPTMTQVFT